MKTLLGILIFVFLSTACASDRWYKFCDVTKYARRHVVNFEEGQTVNPKKYCSEGAIYFHPSKVVCTQRLLALKRNSNRGKYEVIVQTEQGRDYTLIVWARRDFTETTPCRIDSVENYGYTPHQDY